MLSPGTDWVQHTHAHHDLAHWVEQERGFHPSAAQAQRRGSHTFYHVPQRVQQIYHPASNTYRPFQYFGHPFHGIFDTAAHTSYRHFINENHYASDSQNMARSLDGIRHSFHDGLPEARRDSRAPTRPAYRACAGCGDRPPTPGGQFGNSGRLRNPQRGLRSQAQIIARNQARSAKRRDARRDHRAQKRTNKYTKHLNSPGIEATAREPDGPKRT